MISARDGFSTTWAETVSGSTNVTFALAGGMSLFGGGSGRPVTATMPLFFSENLEDLCFPRFKRDDNDDFESSFWRAVGSGLLGGLLFAGQGGWLLEIAAKGVCGT